ncbi:MAG: SRPBCC family protein [Thermodesulfobacteriota bacterium]
MFKKLLLTVLILIAILVIVGLLLPKDYEISRSIEINASKDKIHKYVGDLENWPSWTPWIEADPSINTKIGEKSKGVGASQSWTGKEGDGRLEFTKYDEDKGIGYDLFFMGDQNKCYGEMIYNEGKENSVEVEWNMEGEINMPVIGGYFALMMDRMVGPMFEKGLENLKTVAEINWKK